MQSARLEAKGLAGGDLTRSLASTFVMRNFYTMMQSEEYVWPAAERLFTPPHLFCTLVEFFAFSTVETTDSQHFKILNKFVNFE